MKNEIANEKNTQAEEPIVIADECGDSMWDAVLDQSPFVQASRQAAEKKDSADKKDNQS